MDWWVVIMITFSCVAANHLGLIVTIENIFKTISNLSIPVINCPKCLTFWCLMVYGFIVGDCPVVVIATSFLFAYLAIWLNLAFALLDYCFNSIYDTIYTTTDTTSDHTIDTDGTMSYVSSETGSDKGGREEEN